MSKTLKIDQSLNPAEYAKWIKYLDNRQMLYIYTYTKTGLCEETTNVLIEELVLKIDEFEDSL